MDVSPTIQAICSLIAKCPDESIFACHCNWSNASFTEEEKKILLNKKVDSISDCESSREKEVFKSMKFSPFKPSGTILKELDIPEFFLSFTVKESRKKELIRLTEQYLNDSDISHCRIYRDGRTIGECFDGFELMKLDKLFDYSDQEVEYFASNGLFIMWK